MNTKKEFDTTQKVTAENIKQFRKIIVKEMVKVATSKEGYAVFKELSER